ncbi:helix-turn-helix domain-containing protein [Microbulbifer sp. ALW1]|uniref:helix-turn-helix domain-containing protein n=1 Tax=Microbulbifer sp. (strain ALW1) TaxID=1516059 RepID=UPI00135AD16F|nr:XRE family transcriptional regulator [Microbulbifer sp. ALW1]
MDKLSLDNLGRHLQNLRMARGISLSQLAAAAGIAKSNLSRLEQGNGNPTLDTIWRIAVQLEVPFSQLVEPMTSPVEDEGVLVRLIDRGGDNPQVDAYWMSCAPQTLRVAETHTPGATESVMVISGVLEAGLEGHTRLLGPGESHSFPADHPHLYRTGDAWATLLVTIVYAARGEETL